MKDQYLTLEDLNSYKDTSALGDDSSNALLYQEPTKKKTREEKLDLITDPYRFDTGAEKESQIISNEEYNNLMNSLDKDKPSFTGEVDLSNQSNWRKAINSLTRTVTGELAGGTIEGVGALLDIGAKGIGLNWAVNKVMGTEDVAYENFLTKGGKALREWSNKVAPIYREDPNATFDFGDFGYWAEHFPSAFSSVSSAVTGAGLARGTAGIARNLANVGRAANASKLAKVTGQAGRVLMTRPAQTVITAVGNRAVENYREASQAYDDVYRLASDNLGAMSDKEFDSYKGNNESLLAEAKEFFDKEDISKDDLSKYIATRSADKSFILNSGNLLWDLAQFTAIGKLVDRASDAIRPLSKAAIKAHGKSLGLGEKAIRGKIIKGKAKEALLWAGATLPEAPEEMLNYIGGEEAKRYGEQLLKGEYDEATLLPVMPLDVFTSYGNAELAEAGFWGLVGAGVFGGATKAMSKSGAALNKYRESNGKKAWFNIADAKHEEQMQINEIESREQATRDYQNRISLINQGLNPDNIIVDSNGKPILDADDNVQYESLYAYQIDKYKADTTKEYIRNIAKRAAKSGTIDYFKEYIDSKEFDDTYIYDNLYHDLRKSNKINEDNVSLLDEILKPGNYVSDARKAMRANDATMVKELIKTQLDNIQRLYKQQYNNLLFEDVIPSYINDMIIEDNIDNILLQDDINKELSDYNTYLSVLSNTESEHYNQGFADANGNQLVNDFVTALEYDLLTDLNHRLTTAKDNEKKSIIKQIESIRKSLTNKGLNPDENKNPITDKAYNIEAIGNQLESYGLDDETLVNYGVNNISKSLLNDNVITNKKDAIQKADDIVKSMNAANNLMVADGKAYIESEINKAADAKSLNELVDKIKNKTFEDNNINQLLSVVEGNRPEDFNKYIDGLVKLANNKLEAAAKAATVVGAITKSPVKEGVIPPTVIKSTKTNVEGTGVTNKTSTAPIVKSFTGDVDEVLTKATKDLLNLTLKVNNANLLNYTYKIAKPFKDGAELVNEVQVAINEYNEVEVNTLNKGDYVDGKTDDEALDYLNDLIESGRVVATPVIDNENILASAIEDVNNGALDKLDKFIQASLKARGIKINKTYTPINLLDLVFHATDITKDINQALIIKEQLISGFKRFETLKSKYRVTDQDLEFVSNSKLAGILKQGRSEYLRSELNKQLESNNQLVFDMNNSSLSEMFDPSKRLANGRYTLSATETKIYEAIQALQPYSRVKDQASKVVVRKDEFGNPKVFISYENQLLPIGEIPYVNVDESGITNSKVKNLNYKINNNQVEIISNLIKDMNNQTPSEFVDLYNALMEYKKATKDKDGNKIIDPDYLDTINESELVKNFLSYMVDNDKRDVSLQHLAEIFTFKNISIGTSADNDIRYITNSLLESWQEKVVRNNETYKAFNVMKPDESIDLQVDFINKGFANNSGVNDRNEITFNGVRRSFSKDELSSMEIGYVTRVDNQDQLVFNGITNEDRLNLLGATEGGTFLIYRDPNGVPMRINTMNAPINKNYTKYNRILKDTISKKGNELRDMLNSDIDIFINDLVKATLVNDQAKLESIIEYMDKLIGTIETNKDGKYRRNKGGLISGNGLGYKVTNTGISIFRNIVVDGNRQTFFVGFNFNTSSDRFNITYKDKNGKTVYLNNTKEGIDKGIKVMRKLFYLDETSDNGYLQFNMDRESINAGEFEFTRYNQPNIKYKSYKDYLIDNDLLLTTVAGVTNSNGSKVISGFVPSANSVQTGNYVGSPLTIRLRYEGSSNKTSTPVEGAVDPIDPVVETNTTKLNTILATNPKLSNIINTLNSNSPYAKISNLFDSLGVTIHNEVLKVGEGVPDVYAYFNKDNKTIYLTDKLDNYNTDEVIRTIVHEIMHGAILESGYDINNVQDIYNAALKSNDADVKRYMQYFETMSGDRKLEEFLVEALTSKSFATGLSKSESIKDSFTGDVASTNLLQRVFNIIKELVNSINPSLLTDINVVIDDMYNAVDTTINNEVKVDNSKGSELLNTTANEEIVTEVGTYDDMNIDDNMSDLDMFDDNLDDMFSAIPDVKQVVNMDTYKESIPDKLKSEYEQQVKNGNITYICS